VHGRLLHPAPVPLHERWRCGSHPCLSQLDLDERAAAGSASPDASCGAVTAHSPSPRGASLLLPSTRCLSIRGIRCMPSQRRSQSNTKSQFHAPLLRGDMQGLKRI
uniref:Uncharacterized protein n=1 Tax=Aegilops tauschii subsp. strangulata TaxID=200361 RepID=A0A453MJ69_AEGTS